MTLVENTLVQVVNPQSWAYRKNIIAMVRCGISNVVPMVITVQVLVQVLPAKNPIQTEENKSVLGMCQATAAIGRL
jgi:acetaldehyde dehydrogenase (acetylating)